MASSDDKDKIIAALRKEVVALRELLDEPPTGESKKTSDSVTLERLVEAFGMAFFVIQGEQIIYANQACEALSGRSRQDLYALGFPALVHPDHREMMRTRAIRRQQGQPEPERYEFKLVDEQGRVRWVEVVLGPTEYFDEPAIIGVGVERTSLRAAEEARKESETKFSVFAEASPVATFTHRRGRLLYANSAAVELTGFPLEELLGMAIIELVHPEFKGMVVDKARRWDAGDEGVFPYEVKIVRKDGRERWVELQGIRTDMDGSPAVLGTGVDVSSRKEAEERLRRTEREKATILDAISELLTYHALDGTIIWGNKAAAVSAGMVPDGLSGLTSGELWGRRGVSVRDAIIQPTSSVDGVVTSEVTSSGGRVWEVRGYPVRDEGGVLTGVVEVSEDVTDARRLEAELLKADKLDSLAVMAGGIAHDFNNILTAILGNLSLARMDAFYSVEQAVEKIETAERALLQAKKLTHQLLTFSKGGSPIKQPLSLTKLLTDTMELVLSGANVEYKSALSRDVWLVEADEGQLGQAFSNLLINGLQAMPDGGRLTVMARNVALDEVEHPGLAPGRYVHVAIGDKGVGIAPEALEHIFDPYFSTKEGGTGLGLSSAYSVVRRHGGTITVDSEVGVGTTFDVYLPASDEEELPPEPVKEPVAPGSGRVLVMDDDQLIRRVAVRLLSRAGYEVEAVPTGSVTIDRYAKAMASGTPYDLVILDLTVPGAMGGKETLQELRRIDPDVKAVVSSGYTTDPVLAHPEAYGFVAMVAKPYTYEDIVQVAHDALAAAHRNE